tara:strand:+ start:2245 stop:4959 length:2715 start_codon:yes stop_codon:yes gene_type:complete
MTIQQIFEDNVLNKYDNVTYKWTMYMIRPEDVNQYDRILRTDPPRARVICESGVESEINIQSVEHDMKLTFNKRMTDREAVANMFSMQLIEPQGATLYTRIVVAAQELNIINHLKACYLLELKFLGYNEDGSPANNITSPYYYACTMTALDFQYSEGATRYRADLIETTQDAFKKLTLHLKEDLTIQASTFGNFLSNLEVKVNEQEARQVLNSISKQWPHVYKFGTGGNGAESWGSWAFDTGTGISGETPDLSSVSITGDGNLTFVIKQGTSISDIIIIALMQTKNFRKLPTDDGGFHKDNPNDQTAKPPTFKELSKWFAFDCKTVYMMYDTVAKDFAKEFTINIAGYTVPELSHDAKTFEEVVTKKSIQVARLRNLVSKELLKKRFDYAHTGLNTEVLGLDIYLNNSYYQLQALNQGEGRFEGQSQAGEGKSDNQFNRNSTTISEIKQKLRVAQDELRQIKGQKDSFFSNQANLGNPPELAAKEREFKNKIDAKQEQIKQLEEVKEDIINKTVPLLQEEAAKERLKQGDRANLVSGDRYLTQSELFGRNKLDDNKTHPVSFDISNVNSKATNGPDENDTSGAVFLGAVELNLNSLGDLVQQQINIRGDPYWLGRPKSRKATLYGANYEKGGVSYFLNVNFPTYPNQDSGLMQIPEANFGIVGAYRVHTVVANYSEGQFTMTLQSYRDIQTNVGLLYDLLQKGTIETDEGKPGQPNKIEDQGEGDSEGETTVDNTGPQIIEPPIDGDATGVVTQNQGGSGKIRNQPIASDLNNILAQAGAAAGVNVNVTSGGQPAKGSGGRRTGSTRHDNGHAADVQLALANGRVLSLNNPGDVPIIQNFIRETKRFGATGIGAGNGYMGDNTFHIDNAQKYGQGNAGYWGGHFDNGTYRAKNAPRWLRDIFTA